jgi:glutamate formiminotransferase/formiminotetrahydrofolate cyclodeaminase
MNLTNFRETPVERVVEMIRREAARYGVNIHHCELVGLIPQEALVNAAQWYLQLDQFEAEQILEVRLAKAQKAAAERQTLIAPTPAGFLDALAAGTPAPGGGSASAYSGAAGAALVVMVARLTIGKKKYDAVQAQMQVILERAETLRIDLTAAIQRDADAFSSVLDAFMLPKGAQEEQSARQQAIQAATLEAAQVPLQVARMAVEVLELAAQVVEKGNLNAISDGATGAALARAALTGAGYNVRININSLSDQSPAAPLLAELAELERRAASVEAKIRSEMTTRGGIPLP